MMKVVFVVGCILGGLGVVCYAATIAIVGSGMAEVWSDRGNAAMLLAVVVLLLGLTYSKMKECETDSAKEPE
jgi:hypothetical protein